MIQIGSKKLMLASLVLILTIAIGGGAYWWRDKQAKDDRAKNDNEIVQLRQKVANLEKQLIDSKAKLATEKPVVTNTALNQAMIDNVKAVFATGNTQPLEGYMTAKVTVIIAASEGLGERTAAQATADITSYVGGATDAWNFSLPTATINAYKSGDYGQYFPDGALVGKSNNMVISFTFNDVGKISTVFMTNSAQLL